MDYEWDVFISYRRYDKWIAWINKYFLKMLHDSLQIELKKKNVRIFVDQHNLVEGGDWPASLCDELGHSRILLPLFCAGYWDSQWCKRELALMLEREERCGIRANPKRGLIVPILIHDGEIRPKLVTKIHTFVADKNHVGTHVSGKVGLERFVNRVAVRIAEHTLHCPSFSDEFGKYDVNAFFTQLAPNLPPHNEFPGIA